MADRYWIGGTGNWSDTDHWSTESGGDGGADVPTSSDDVFIDENSGFGGGGTITIDTYEAACADFTCTSGDAYTITDGRLGVFGSLELESGITWGVENLVMMGCTVGGNFTIKTNGVKLINFYIEMMLS